MFSQIIMRRTSLIIALSLIAICFLRIGSGQVTFSRDWNPGKRSISGDKNCLGNAKTAAATFHILMNELRYLSACEERAMVQFLKTQKDVASGKTIYYGGR